MHGHRSEVERIRKIKQLSNFTKEDLIKPPQEPLLKTEKNSIENYCSQVHISEKAWYTFFAAQNNPTGTIKDGFLGFLKVFKKSYLEIFGNKCKLGPDIYAVTREKGNLIIYNPGGICVYPPSLAGRLVDRKFNFSSDPRDAFYNYGEPWIDTDIGEKFRHEIETTKPQPTIEEILEIYTPSIDKSF